MRSGLTAAANVAKAWLVLGGPVAGLGALGWWLGELRVAGVFLAAMLVLVGTIVVYGSRALLASMGARELTVAESPVLQAAASRLAAAAGVSAPRLYLLDDGFPRILSVGRGARDVHVAVSRGLLGLASPAELEALLAHELAHARARDTTIQTPVVLLALWLIEASRIGGYFQRALLFVLAPIAASLVQISLSPKREFAADRMAAALCGSPHPLADGLTRLEQAMEVVDFRGSPATEPLYVANPFGNERLAAMFSTHPPIAERIRRLRALAPGGQAGARPHAGATAGP